MPFNLGDTLNILQGNSEELVLAQCNIGEPEIQQIADTLAANTSLLSIDLSDNPISIRGLEILSKSLSRHPRLKRLVLAGLYSNDKPKGLEYIQALAPIFETPQLRELILQQSNHLQKF
jgi:Ran GTPase-activating protein (RanGAP) involved in mRNA processing and transport